MSVTRSFRARFIRAQRGSVAIEFALVATAFILLLFAILQFALFVLARVIMHDTLSDLATGDGFAMLAAGNSAETRDHICDRLIFSPDCRRGLRLEMLALRAATGNQISNSFSSGASGTLMVVRAEAPIAVFVPFVETLSVQGKALFLQP